MNITKKHGEIMSFRKIKPTKTNLMNLQERLHFANQGREFLDYKRQELILEIKKRWTSYLETREEFSRIFKKSLKALNGVYMKFSKSSMVLLSQVMKGQRSVSVKVHQVKDVGVKIPKIRHEQVIRNQLPSYAHSSSPVELDRLIDEILPEFISIMLQHAEKEDIMLKFAHNFKNLNRRMNSLKFIIIPELEQQIKRIKTLLEEYERENFVRFKKTKDMIERKYDA
ncbi:V-type ATP synthase subunit D [Candidatus Bathyarchaeota archaeon]|nr:V-type ATP synthase subunit D [Candidatus Bathyarchaeota archaeon]